jgi:sensor domain CHASE-containing protein
MTEMKEQDDEKRPIFGNAVGDLGVVVIAMLCTIALLLILFSPSPFQKLEQAQARQEKERIAKEIAKVQAERQRKIDEAVASGVVTVGITPAKPK